MTTKAQQLVEEVRKRKEAEALAAATGDDTSALDDLMGDIMGDPTTPDTATPEFEPGLHDDATPEVTTKVTEPVDDGFITIVPVDPTKAPSGIVIEDLQIGDQPPSQPATPAQPAPAEAPEAPKARQTRTKPKVTETPAEAPKIGADGVPLTRAQQRTLDELEAGRKALAKRG